MLVFRASGVINFAQGQFGALGASIMAVLLRERRASRSGSRCRSRSSPARVLGGLTELLVVRRLFNQPRLLLFVATIGVAQVILLLQLQLPQIEPTGRLPDADRRASGRSAPSPSAASSCVVLIVVPLIVVVLAFLLQRTRFGLAVRSAADNPSAASLSGVRVKAVSTQVWVARRRAGVGQRACSPHRS